jgi:hypothetical protein
MLGSKGLSATIIVPYRLAEYHPLFSTKNNSGQFAAVWVSEAWVREFCVHMAVSNQQPTSTV